MVLFPEYKKAKEQHRNHNMPRRSDLNQARNVIKEFEHPSIQGRTMYSSVIGGSNEEGTWRSTDSAANTDSPATMSDLHSLIQAFISFKKAGTHSLDPKPIIIDSGASHHMISDRNLMSDVQPASGNVQIANGDKIKIEGIGNLRLFDRESTALYMPQFTSNLLSVRKATVDLSCQVVFRPDEVEFQDLKTGQVIGKGHVHNELYHLQKTEMSRPSTSQCLASTSSGVDSTLWHARLGPSTAADSVESTHPNHEGDSRNVEQSTQAQPEESSVAHDQDEMPSESGVETQVEAPSEGNEAEPEQKQLMRRSTRIRKPSQWINTEVYFNAEAYLANGQPERKKTRLVTRGYTQVYGEDYLDTFAPVAKLHTIRIVLSLAVNLEWDLWQMDVKNAFLQGELEDEVYMRPPPGMEHLTKPGNVLRLKKAIYGLKQSPRAWYHKLSTTLNGRGFVKSEADHTLFTLTSQQGIIVILIYVDDIIITGSDKEGIISTKAFLKASFDIKDLGELKYFLGIEMCRSKEGLFLSQRKYTLDLLNEAGDLGGRAAKTPLEEGYKVMREGEIEDKSYEDVKHYRRMVGKLIYLTITRPDVCFAVNQVSQHMQAPKVHHWNMVERILRYLREAPGQGVWMGCNRSTEIVGYCDADWAGDRVDRRSTTGYCTFIGGNLVTWKSKKQKVVSCSSAEAEYRAMKKLTSELIWIKGLLKDLGIEVTTPITMHCDNQAAIRIMWDHLLRTKGEVVLGLIHINLSHVQTQPKKKMRKSWMFYSAIHIMWDHLFKYKQRLLQQIVEVGTNGNLNAPLDHSRLYKQQVAHQTRRYKLLVDIMLLLQLQHYFTSLKSIVVVLPRHENTWLRTGTSSAISFHIISLWASLFSMGDVLISFFNISKLTWRFASRKERLGMKWKVAVGEEKGV
ncbi:PREDICTED: uncharacterized protein LOC106297627 [Brassica oleracea var. oleracea]|uniref:uncharacterized protein LOC106297627 n=1 Tax=Brassica oleracea var. oleracea TaxID=109376 RepID=UPI0006A6DDEE|nr:PREDICTED: uncharacterized protein LOC106297627 [Brassica oleracea var. oleracea]